MIDAGATVLAAEKEDDDADYEHKEEETGDAAGCLAFKDPALRLCGLMGIVCVGGVCDDGVD